MGPLHTRLVIIGELMLTGRYNPERVGKLWVGSVVKGTKNIITTKIGSEVSTFLYAVGV